MPLRHPFTALRILCGLVVFSLPAPTAFAQPDAALPVATTAADAPDWIQPGDPARLALSRSLAPDEGRLAILIGDTDWSGMTEVAGTIVRVVPTRAGFPSGEHAVSMYLVARDQQWQPIGQTTLRVLTASGFERATTAPALELGLTGQARLARTPAVPPTPRDTFQDLTVRAGVDGHYVRGGWTTTAQTQVVGVTFREQALRFNELQQDAPLLDLGSYHAGVRNGVVSLAAGHVSVGTHRMLLNGFASRGLTGTIRMGPMLDVALSAVNGTTLVGYGNILGLADDEHRIVNATLGVELIPSRRGGLRVSGSLVDGSIQPATNVNQGAVRDPEQSRGLGLQVTAHDAATRFHLDAGIARSRFVNPRDPFAPPELAIIDVRETTRSARHMDVSYALVQNARLGPAAVASLTAAFRHSRVDPLYRSVALPVRADLEQNAVDLTTTLGAFTSQVTVDDARDNLADLGSLLTTRTRQVLWTSALPLQAFAADNPGAAAWPTISYALSRVHQRADGLPDGGLFDSASQVPDQVSLNQTLGVTWQGTVWYGGYALNRSFQDNRQPGREQADLLNLVHAVNAGVMASSYLDAGVEFAFEDAETREVSRTDITRRVSGSVTVRPALRTSLTAIVTRNRFEDTPRTSTRRTTDVNLTFTQGVSLLRQRPDRLSGQFFVRYVRQSIYGLLPGVVEPDDTRFWTLNTGLTFRFF